MFIKSVVCNVWGATPAVVEYFKERYVAIDIFCYYFFLLAIRMVYILKIMYSVRHRPPVLTVP
jgi:hypothetical protein